MGYTHYWHSNLNADEQGQWRMRCLPIIRHGVENHVLGTWDGLDKLTVTEWISSGAFNGRRDISKDGRRQDHETFRLRHPSDPEDDDFNFCKTAGKDYDEYVVACILMAEHMFPDKVNWSSDGDEDPHAFDKGRKLFQYALSKSKDLSSERESWF